jgi:hypothetical protein
MPVLEVPSNPWDTALEPSVVAVLINAADATNICALALAHADYLEQQADTTWQQTDRSLQDRHLSMSDCHLQLAHAASAYGDELLRIYAWQAFHFARLPAGAMNSRNSGNPTPLDAESLPVRYVITDPTTLPPPTTAVSNGQPDTELLESHQAVLDAVASVDTDDPDHPLEDFDLGTPPNTGIDLRGQGLDRLAVALHSYADRCLWRARPGIGG